MNKIGGRASATLFTLRWNRIFILAGAVVLLLKLWLAWFSPGTQDVQTWEIFVSDAQKMSGLAVYHQPYTATTFFNHPPFMLHFVRALGWFAQETAWPLRFCLRILPSLADVGSLWILWKIACHRATAAAVESPNRSTINRIAPWSLLLFACAPAAILISGFHGNTDPIMTGFLLLSIYLVELEKPAWQVGVAFGLSLSIKVVPIMLVPLFLFYLRTPRRQIEYSIAAFATFFCLGLPFMVQEPSFILQRVFGYGGQYGIWGISRFLRLFAGDSSWFQQFGRATLLLSLVGYSWWLNRLPRQPDLLRQAALLLALFFTITPSFAVQYLEWITPFLVVFEFSSALVFTLTSGFFLSLTYFNFWNWYASQRSPSPALDMTLLFAEILCWLMVAALFFLETRRLKRNISRPTSQFSDFEYSI